MFLLNMGAMEYVVYSSKEVDSGFTQEPLLTRELGSSWPFSRAVGTGRSQGAGEMGWRRCHKRAGTGRFITCVIMDVAEEEGGWNGSLTLPGRK